MEALLELFSFLNIESAFEPVTLPFKSALITPTVYSLMREFEITYYSLKFVKAAVRSHFCVLNMKHIYT